MSELTLTFLIGMPRAGKTTYAKKYLKSEEIISPDEIRLKYFHVIYDREIEPRVWKVVQYLVERNLKNGISCVLDATNLSKNDRRPYIEIAKQYKAKIKIIVFRTPYEICIERNNAMKNGKRLKKKTMEHYKYKYERFIRDFPEIMNNFDEIQFIVEPSFVKKKA